jgi:Flp pilus assembly pilin Flp
VGAFELIPHPRWRKSGGVSKVLTMKRALYRLLADDGQDVAGYAVMLAVVLAVVVGTIRLIGSSANNVFSSVGSSIQ